MRYRNVAPGNRLEIEDIECVGRGADDHRLLQGLVHQTERIRGPAG